MNLHENIEMLVCGLKFASEFPMWTLSVMSAA